MIPQKITRHAQLGLLGMSMLMLGLACVKEAQAIHPRTRVWTYGAYYGGPAYLGPGALEPAGFGFGGYSYGGYPYYGYWGYAPGPYAGFSGYGAPVGPGGYCAYPGAVPAPAYVAEPAACVPPCFATPHACRRYLRRMNRALARSCWSCLPTGIPCPYGVMFGDVDAGIDNGDMNSDVQDEPIGIDPTLDLDGAESVAPPEENAPRPGLERSL